MTGTDGEAGATGTFVVHSATPDLWYKCTRHSGMGNMAATPTVTYHYNVSYERVNGTRKYFIQTDGAALVDRPQLNLQPGIHIFNLGDSSLGWHPFRFTPSLVGDGEDYNLYTDGWTMTGTDGEAGATGTFVVHSATPDLWYKCTRHSGMGNMAATPTVTYHYNVSYERVNGTRKYFIQTDGAALVDRPQLNLQPGIHIFNLGDSSLGWHPFRFTTTLDGDGEDYNLYTDGWTMNGTDGEAGATGTFVVHSATPGLWYKCTRHSGMGNVAIVTLLPSPPPPSSPTPAGSIHLALRASGTVDDYTPSVQLEIRQVFAAQAGVPTDQVQLQVTSASVLLAVTIVPSSPAQAMSLAATMNSAVASASAATALLASVTSLAITVDSIVEAPTAAIPPATP